MTNLPHVPPPRGDLTAIARSAAESVPAGLSARRWQVRVFGALILPICVAAPFIGAGVVATVAAAAVLVRLVALFHLLRGDRPSEVAAPATLPPITVLLPLHKEVPVVVGLVASVRGLD